MLVESAAIWLSLYLCDKELYKFLILADFFDQYHIELVHVYFTISSMKEDRCVVNKRTSHSICSLHLISGKAHV